MLRTYVYELSAPHEDAEPFLIVAPNYGKARVLANKYFKDHPDFSYLEGDAFEDFGIVVISFDEDIAELAGLYAHIIREEK